MVVIDNYEKLKKKYMILIYQILFLLDDEFW